MVAAAVQEADARPEAAPRGFKQTEIGLIPEDWEVYSVFEICDQPLQNGLFYEVSRKGRGVPIINVGDLYKSAPMDPADLELFDASHDEKHRFGVSAGDLFFTRSSIVPSGIAFCNWIGELCGNEIVFDSHVVRFSPNQKIAVPGYVYGSLLTRSARSQLIANAKTATMTTIDQSGIGSCKVPLPPLAEQESIAGAFSDADGAIRAVERALAKQRAVKHAALHALLTPTTRLPGFEGGWETKTFGQLATPRRERINPQTGQHSDFCVELDNIGQDSGQLLGWTETTPDASLKTVFRNGDVLFGKLRSYLRKYWFADRAGVCSTEIWALEPTPQCAVGEFVYQVVQQDHFIDASSMAYGTHMPRSDWNIVAAIEISLPPLPEQRAIAAVLSDMDAAIAALETRRDKLKAVKQGMMQALLTGKVRLV